MSKLTPESLISIKKTYDLLRKEELKLLGSLFGVNIFVDPHMPKDQWKIVCGENVYGEILKEQALAEKMVPDEKKLINLLNELQSDGPENIDYCSYVSKQQLAEHIFDRFASVKDDKVALETENKMLREVIEKLQNTIASQKRGAYEKE